MVLINDRKNQDIKERRIKMYITGQYYIQVKIFKPRLNLNFILSPSPKSSKYKLGLGDKGN